MNVRRHGLGEHLARHLLEEPVGDDSRGVDDDEPATEGLRGIRDGPRDRLLVADVELDDGRRTAPPPALGGDVLEHPGGAAGEHDRDAVVGEAQGGRPADPA